MSTTTIVTCDRCKSTGTPGRWDDGVAHYVFEIAEDGCNKFMAIDHDLCRGCRSELIRTLEKFFKPSEQ